MGGTPIANQTFTATYTDSSGNAGTTYIDDCFLGPSGGANRLANPGFESGATAWSLNGTPFTILQNP